MKTAPKFTYAYDPELDMWAVMEDGYVVSREAYESEAIALIKELAEANGQFGAGA